MSVKTRKNIKRVLGSLGLVALVGSVLLIGLFRFVLVRHDNPPVVSEPNWDSPQTRDLAQRACFDCHSNETNWPLYSYIPPISMRLEESVREGREVVNFSDWQNVRGEGEGGSAHELIESIREGEMPPADYLAMHPEARLTAAEQDQLVAGLQATVADSPRSGGGGGESGEDEEHENENGEHEDEDD